MTVCQWSIFILSANWWTSGELKEKIFLLCDDELLLQTDASPSNKLMDRSRIEVENVSTLPWWSVAADGSASFKDTSGQGENRRRNIFYFAMTICRRWRICVLQGHFGTDREQKEKLFLLCDDDLLPLMDLRPSRTFSDRSRTEGEIVSTLRWWSVAADVCTLGWWSVSVMRCHCEYAIQHASREYVQLIY